MNPLDKLRLFMNTALDAPLVLSLTREKFISEFNMNLKAKHLTGTTNRWIIASITSGEEDYRHSMCTKEFPTGFTLTVQNDSDLGLVEANSIALYVLKNPSLVNSLMSLGFDTLYVQGKTTESIGFKLSNYQG